MAFRGVDFYRIDDLLTDEERIVRDTVRRFIDERVMGHPVPKENSKEANPKVRDLEKQLKDNLGKWNAERERLVMQIQRLEESARQWDTERRRLNEHAGQLQQAFVQASAKIQTLEVAAREPSSSELKLEELKNQNAEVEQQLEAAQSRWDAERRDMKSARDMSVRRISVEMTQSSSLSTMSAISNLSTPEHRLSNSCVMQYCKWRRFCNRWKSGFPSPP